MLSNTYKIERKHIEELILTCFLNQHRTLEMDKLEYEAYKLPFELFKASRTIKMIAKAIYNLQSENIPIDDETVLCYIKKHAEINVDEFLQITCLCWMSFDSMCLYLNRLKNIEKEEEKMRVLEKLR